MSKPYVTLLGKAVRSIARLRGGSGSALPGLFVEKIDPDFIKRTLAGLPHGVVLVSGTNGKTTTTKMIVELLEGQGLRVFTNRTGSNFTRGVAAALLGEVDLRGRLSADIAVLELDEAHATHFVRAVAPRYSLLLNVMRDQLDRFGEIDTTAKLLQTIAEATTDTVILNREDRRVAALAKSLTTQEAVYFGLSPELRQLFPDDDSLVAEVAKVASDEPPALVTLTAIDDHTATFLLDDVEHQATLALEGVYNIYNAAAALTLVQTVLGEATDRTKLLEDVATVQPAFGRGEKLTVGGHPLELVLVKNPSGFRLGLSSFSPKGYATMIAINDNYADGRDMSWLWDVTFTSLRTTGVALTTGVRAADMALRLDYDHVAVGSIEPNLQVALRSFINDYADQPKRIYCTYTAMLALRKELSKITTVQEIG